ncbi:hypothetical protein D3C86_1948970 [compost metagenome]
MRLKIQKTANTDHAYPLRLNRGDGNLFWAEPCGTEHTERGDALMISTRMSTESRPAGGEQRFSLIGKTRDIVRAHQPIGMICGQCVGVLQRG